MKNELLKSIAILSLSTSAWAGPCTSGSLASYWGSGFTCTVGDLQFSNFFASGSFFGSDRYRTANWPADITITPVSTAGGDGFTLSNMNLSFKSGMSSISGWLVFDASAVSGLITGASIMMGPHSFNADGYVQAHIGDYDSSIFGVNAWVDKNFDTTSGSTSFPGVADFRAFAAATAGGGSFNAGNHAFVDGYTMLLSTTLETDPHSVPEPGSALLLLSGLGLFARRQWRSEQTGADRSDRSRPHAA